MIDVVIIGQNEGDSVMAMHDSLLKYTFIENIIWVVDRSTDNTVEQLKSLGEMFVCTPEKLEGRQTSYCRNLGLKLTNPNNDVLFLDGDRYPVSGDLTSLLSYNEDVILLKLEADARDNIFDWKHRCYGQVCNFFYSCGLLVKRKAITILQNFQNGQLFDESLQGIWGVEDTYLGDVCYHLKLTADVEPNIRLNGGFSNTYFKDFEALKMRFEKRDRLNVEW